MHTEDGLAGIKHDYTALGFVCCSSDCKNHHCIISCCDSRLKLYFQPAPESPKTVVVLEVDGKMVYSWKWSDYSPPN